jgi:hypothetical protein
MSQDTIPTRRSFLKGGAIIAAPLAVAVAPAAALAADESRRRLAQLEDEKAIQALHQGLVRHINSGAHDAAASLFAEPASASLDAALCAVASDHAGAPDSIAFSADGLRATGLYAALVETVRMIPADSTLAQMAHAQGEGYVRESGRHIVRADYVKTQAGWAIARVDFARV